MSEDDMKIFLNAKEEQQLLHLGYLKDGWVISGPFKDMQYVVPSLLPTTPEGDA